MGLITIYKKREIIYPKTMQERNTSQKKLVLDLMTGNFTHPTADEIYEAARKSDPHISRGTVYRNLSALSKSGKILKISVPDGADHYDITTREHYHFCCETCGKMFDAPESVRIETESAAKEMEAQGFRISGKSLIFTGLCPSCAEKAAE